MSDALSRLLEGGWVSILNARAAETWGRIGGEGRPEVLALAALCGQAVEAGHVCLDLNHLTSWCDASGRLLPEWLERDVEVCSAWLESSPLVATAEATDSAEGAEVRPLVLDAARRLYLRRYWDYQESLALGIRGRLAEHSPLDVDEDCLREGLDRLFGDEAAEQEPDFQRMAASGAVRSRFFVLSGGPGTGKTSTVARILALLIEQSEAVSKAGLRIRLLAPTGKAAAHLGQSIARAIQSLNCAQVTRGAIPTEASTVHRALGAGGTPTRYRYDAAYPLPVDVVLVDEASMVDIALMARLVAALPPDARLILLGDRDQLASVEAGAVLGDIAGSRALAANPGRPPAALQLVKSHRFAPGSGLGALVEAVHEGDAETVLDLLEDPSQPDLRRLDPEESDRLRAEVARGYEPFAVADDAPGRLAALEHYRILCAHRMGQDGLTALNSLVESILFEQGAINPKAGLWYDGRPILVTQNDYISGLYNGDVGVVGCSSGEDRSQREDFRVLFEKPEGGPRWLGVRRLGPVETVFAMTVHKSQGSEFDQVLLVLPTEPSPVATRELLYTAISRARRGVCVRAGEEAIRSALRRRVERMSGLAEALESERF